MATKRNAFSLAAEADGRSAAARSERDSGPDAPALCAAPEPVLPQGSACELRQARADADVGADFRGRGDAGALAGALLGREPAARPAAARAVPGGRRDHRAPHVREARVSSSPQWYRQWGAKVVLGGLHVLSAPEEAAAHADAIAIGEGVQVWPQILADVEAGKLQARVSRRLPQAVSRRSGAAPRFAAAFEASSRRRA